MAITRAMSKKAKKKKKEEEEVDEDRLSDLPDTILVHILSFLPEIRFCVRTTLLSKRWNNVWASLPDLIFDNYQGGRNAQWFKNFVSHVLFRRDNLPLNKLSFKYHEEDKSLFTSLINYAMSYNVQHFSLSLRSPSLTCLFPLFNISNSLKTLNLEFFSNLHLLEDFTLPSLTTLNLFFCSFRDNGEFVSIDPFVGLFNLKSLQLVDCSMATISNLKISGPQLVSLTITGLHRCFSLQITGLQVEILAPKLRFFSTRCFHQMKFSDLDFPLLEIVDIGLLVDADLMTMFRQLYNAQSLVLSSGMIKGLMKFPDVLEDQSSPFVRLKTLKVRCPAHLVSSFNMPDIVMKYFGENITVEKING